MDDTDDSESSGQESQHSPVPEMADYKVKVPGAVGPHTYTLHLDHCPPLLFEVPKYKNAALVPVTPLCDWATLSLKMYHNPTCIFPATVLAFSYLFLHML